VEVGGEQLVVAEAVEIVQEEVGDTLRMRIFRVRGESMEEGH